MAINSIKLLLRDVRQVEPKPKCECVCNGRKEREPGALSLVSRSSACISCATSASPRGTPAPEKASRISRAFSVPEPSRSRRLKTCVTQPKQEIVRPLPGYDRRVPEQEKFF